MIFYISQSTLYAPSSHLSENSSPLLGAPTVIKFLTGYLILHAYTIYLAMREPWDKPTILNYLSEKTGCYYILLQACSAYV